MNKEKENSETKHSSEEVEKCILLLEDLAKDAGRLANLPEQQRIALLKVAGGISRPDRAELKKRNKASKKNQRLATREKNRSARNTTGIRTARRDATFIAPQQIESHASAPVHEGGKLDSPRNCYVCKAEYTTLHFFYDALCKKCGDLNYRKRFQTASLQGKVALITGARVKIGYQATLQMLRAGATVIATTRFPVDAAIRYSREEGYALWGDRLHIHGLDLRHIPSVELFTRYVEQRHGRLDLLINNAAQTVRRPPGFYAHLMEKEKIGHSLLSPEAQKLLIDHEACKKQLASFSRKNAEQESALPAAWHDQVPGIGLRESARLSQIPYCPDDSLVAEEIFPHGRLDADLQQVDLRKTNSWRLRLGEIPTTEMLEVQLVNAVAPFILCNRLVSLMRRDYTGQKHIVNVTAMEGKFFRFKKDERHPHTNMAKAALNMMTHTSAEDLAKDGIYMNAVDTGWVTDEDPAELSQFKQQVHDFQPPLDIVDGAARVCDPFFDGILTGKHWWGKFLKDYFPIDW
ncbi:MAG: SDR family oxidoreductase [Nitrospiraceae bacterium]|nr:SDR family oxidoreductase [Nitrospiraceae bacterium]